MAESNTETKLKRIVNEVLSIRNNLKEDPTEEAKLPEDVERDGIYSLVNLYAEHAAMFEILSKKLLGIELKTVEIEELENGNYEIKENKNTIKKILGNDKIKKEHINKLKEIKDVLELSDNEESKKIIKLINELIELKDTKKHIAVDRLRASGEKEGKQPKENLRAAARKKTEYETSNDLNNFKGIPNSIHITDIHNDMYHFLLGMTEPVTVDNSTEPAFIIDNPSTMTEEVNGTKYEYPNLKYNKNFKGTITFGGDLIQSHDSGVDDNLGAIPLCLAMKHCMEEASKNGKKIIYVAGNHELEALNEGQHPEVRTIMQDMFKEGLVEYCHYDRNPKPNGTFISHTKLNKKLIEVIGNDVDGYGGLFDGEKPNRKLKEITTTEQREQLAKLLNENFTKHFEINKEALFSKGPEGISDFAIVGEELERTYFRGDDKCTEARDAFEKKYKNENKNKDENGLKKLEVLKIAALVLSKNKNKPFTSDEKKVNNFADLKEKFENLKDKTYTATLKDSEGKKNSEGKIKEEECKVEINQNDRTISVIKDGIPIGTFTLDELGSSFAIAINSNPNSKPYSLMNRGALLNFSGGLFGYEDDHPEEALDLGCYHVVGHRPTISLEKVIEDGEKKDYYISLNTPIVERIKDQTETTLQTDYNGKNEDKYVNCRITKFDGDGKPHLVGISKMSEEHREFFDNNKELNEEIRRLFDDIYQEKNIIEPSITKGKRNKFIDYFRSNPPPDSSENPGQEEEKLREYFEKFGENHELKINGKILGSTDDKTIDNLSKAMRNLKLIQKYQEIFFEKRKLIIEKQDNIKQKKSQEQSQGQGTIMTQGKS